MAKYCPDDGGFTGKAARCCGGATDPIDKTPLDIKSAIFKVGASF